MVILRKMFLQVIIRKKVKKGLKIAAIIAGTILLIDIVSFIVYVIVFGLPQ